MKKIKIPVHIFIFPFVSIMLACNHSPKDFAPSQEILEIYPDYTSIVVPPNIAPLNFRIENEGQDFVAVITNSKGSTILVRSRSGDIEIPGKAWKKLLAEDHGGSLTLDIYRRNSDKSWEKFNTVNNNIATEEIDSYIAFRKIPPANIIWKKMGIFQRSLESFKVSPIMENSISDDNCMNCHSFNAGNPEQMVFHMRASYGGTFILNNDEVHFVDTKSDHTRSAGAYPSWHPGGELITFSVNKINQGFHSKIGKISYVYDQFSDIVLYDIKENSITRPEELSTKNLENLPTWSPDGKMMYYICAREIVDSLPYDEKKYNLVCIDFDEKTRKFGKADTILKYEELGKSITFPRVSSRNNLIAFVGIDYGYFSIHNKEADIYLYNTETRQSVKPDINSEETESYPSWSSNGSWLMFVSKRDDGILSQVWFSYTDENGQTSKPFVLPQKHPGFYDDYLFNYNRPEFIRGKVNLNPRKVFSIVKSGSKPTIFNEEGSVSLSTGATITSSEPERDIYRKD